MPTRPATMAEAADAPLPATTREAEPVAAGTPRTDTRSASGPPATPADLMAPEPRLPVREQADSLAHIRGDDDDDDVTPAWPSSSTPPCCPTFPMWRLY
ncbi:hypothetical protein [Nonomuraea jiangxiensis]|nr:hypothetical protein [Nonomuraea jiangxiensis]